ncbi:hypothetical protein HOLleu_04209 [Holothuria leucospilota]|uniref:Uncharacterized protein n=1 Tax=Holothuria leucospilota TaxID=206669 RepID=A0A9Q1HM69_HOLLE|nr:hypothetical protein HOLleu_04209 [Holothuria leucospilota]
MLKKEEENPPQTANLVLMEQTRKTMQATEHVFVQTSTHAKIDLDHVQFVSKKG